MTTTDLMDKLQQQLKLITGSKVNLNNNKDGDWEIRRRRSMHDLSILIDSAAESDYTQ